MLVDGRLSKVTVSCRIAGIPQVTRVKLPQTSWGQPWRFSRADKVMSVASVLLIAALGTLFALANDNLVSSLIGWAIVAFGLFIYPVRIWRANRKNRLFLGV